MAFSFLFLILFSVFRENIIDWLKVHFSETGAVLALGIVGAAVLLVPAFFMMSKEKALVPVCIEHYKGKSFIILSAVTAAAAAVFISQIQAMLISSATAEEMNVASGGVLFAYYISFSLVPAICEEIFLRKAVLVHVSKRYSSIFAILLTSFYFAILHGNMYTFIAPFIIGMILGFSVLVTGKLWPALTIHIFVNSYSFYFESKLGASDITDARLIFFLFNMFVLLIGGYFLLNSYSKNRDKLRLPVKGGLKSAFSELLKTRNSFFIILAMIAAYIIFNVLTAIL